MADIGGGFLENRHGKFVKDDGTTAPYTHTSDMAAPYVSRMSDFWLSAIDNNGIIGSEQLHSNDYQMPK